MNDTAKYETDAHVAYVDQARGAGIIVCPPTAEDVRVDHSGPSMHQADFTTITATLGRAGWAVLSDEYGDPVVMGNLNDGRTVLWLYAGAEEDADEPLTDDETYTRACIALVLTHFPQ